MRLRGWLILFAIPIAAILALKWRAEPAGRETTGSSTNAAATASRPGLSSEPATARPSGRNVRSTRPETKRDPEAEARKKFREYLSGGLNPAQITVEQLQQHIDANKGSVESHLAAFQSSGDPQWLSNAATLHPDDPRVHFSMISHGSDDQSRREWLERLKASDPENALANFLSARDHFKNGRVEEAIEDLLAGANKPGFNDYTQHDIQSAEEMYLATGKDPVEAKLLANIQQRLPHLKELRNLPRDLVKLQEAAVTRGDTQTVNDLAQLGITIGQSSGRNDGVNYLLNDLVGIAIQKQMLGSLDPAGAYPFLNQTPAETLAGLDLRVQEIRKVAKTAGNLADAPQNDIIAYLDRSRIHGEFNALQWLANKQAALAP